MKIISELRIHTSREPGQRLLVIHSLPLQLHQGELLGLPFRSVSSGDTPPLLALPRGGALQTFTCRMKTQTIFIQTLYRQLLYMNTCTCTCKSILSVPNLLWPAQIRLPYMYLIM